MGVLESIAEKTAIIAVLVNFHFYIIISNDLDKIVSIFFSFVIKLTSRSK